MISSRSDEDTGVHVPCFSDFIFGYIYKEILYTRVETIIYAYDFSYIYIFLDFHNLLH